MNRLWKFVAPLFAVGLLTGCADDIPPIPNTNDALVGVSGPGSGDPGPILDSGMSFDQGVGPRFDANMQPCSPGSRPSACSICNPSGQLEMPDDDSLCPEINCMVGAMGAYEQVIEGEELVCYQLQGAPRLPGRCAELGRCAEPEEYCGDMMRVEVERIPSDPCTVMDGCEDNQAPDVRTLQTGDECNRIGICRPNGSGGSECTVQVPGNCRLPDAADAKFFCASGQENGRQYCEFFVEPPNGGRTTCDVFCRGLGMEICDDGQQCCWNNSTSTNCDRVEGILCTGTPCNGQACTDQICRCYLPN